MVAAAAGLGRRRGGGKSSFSTALNCTTSHRIPASASTNHGPEKCDLTPRLAAAAGYGAAQIRPHDTPDSDAQLVVLDRYVA